MVVRKRTSMFAPVAEPVHAPTDTSFTGRLSATWEQLGTTSNLAQMSRLNRERQRDDDVEVTEQQLLSGLPEERHAEVLQEAATNGNRAGLMLRDQMSEDLKNTRIMDEMPWYAQMGYGLTTALDPMFLVPGGQAVKGAQAVGQVTKSALTRMGVESPLMSTGAAWVAGAGMESTLYNSPRLGGDHLYNQKDFINDVMMETVMGAGLGMTIKAGGLLRSKQRERHATKMKDIETANKQRERELAGDWSDFELTESTEALNKLYGDKTKFADNTAKWNHEAIVQELDVLNTTIGRVQGLQGDVGKATKHVINDEVNQLVERIKYHNNTEADAISILDSITDLNKRVSNLSGDYKSIASLEGQHATAVMRQILKESLDTTLESAVGSRNATRLTRPQAAKISSMGMSGRMKSAMDSTIAKMQVKAEFADEVAMKLARLHLFYKGKVPATKLQLVELADQAVQNGNIDAANKLLKTINDEVIPEEITGFEFKPARPETQIKPDGTVNSINKGHVPAYVVRDVLDGMKNTDEHARLMESMKGSKAVFGNVSDDGIEITPEVAGVVGKKMFQESADKLTEEVNKYARGEMHLVDHASKPADFVAKMGHYAGRAFNLTKDMASSLKESGSTTLHYVGSRFTEMGKGYGGSMTRRHTAGVIKEAELTKSLSQVLPSYYQNLQKWVAAKGKGKVAQYNAANKTGLQNELADQFNREFMSIMNRLNLGKDVNDMTEPMQAMVNDWNKYMSHNHGKLVDNAIEGFTAERKINNYVPQVWQDGRIRELIGLGEETKVRNTLIAGYRSAGNKNPESAADSLLEWIKTGSDTATLADDQFMPRVDARAQARMAIDWDASAGDLKVIDLLDTEVPAMATKYSNRMAGWVGVAKASDGQVRNGTDLNVLREMTNAETNGNAKALAMHDDVFDLLFGRPTRGGLPDWARNLKELATLSRMGGLGSAQLAETGVVATRSIVETTQDRKFLKKILQHSRKGEEYNDLLEMTKLTGYDEDYALLNRQSVNLDVAEGRMDSDMVNRFNKLSDVLTFGSAKATGSRALGQVTGYDAIRKYQSFVAQRSFGMAVARHFKYGQSKLTNGRLADYGLTDVNGKNTRMKEMFEKHVVFDEDGYPLKYNFDKWDTEVLDQFRYATQRMEAQTQARALVGELPVWMNKPAMGVLMQFRQMGITTQNKSLARNAAFGDKEAMTEFTLATMSASAVRAAKVYGLAASAAALRGDTTFDSELEKRQRMAEHNKLMPFGADMYVNHLGAFADVYNTSAVIGQVVDGSKPEQLYSQVPMFGLIGSMYKTGEAVLEGDLDKAVNNAKGMAILGNTFMVDAFADALEQ